MVSGRVGEEERLFSGEKKSNKSISNLMEALATRPEGWTCSILNEPCVLHRLDSSGADLLARSLSRRLLPSGFRPGSPQENFFGVTFRSISPVHLLIYDFSVHSQSKPRTALQSNDQVPGNQPIRRQHVMCNHVRSIVFACFLFSHRTALFRLMVHLEFF